MVHPDDLEGPKDTPKAGYRDVEVLYNNCSDPIRYRVYESMYVRAYESFYAEGVTPKFFWIVGYELIDGKPSDERTHANLANICTIKVIGKKTDSASCFAGKMI